MQQATRLGRHQLIVGYQTFTLDKDERCCETISMRGTESFDIAAQPSVGHRLGRSRYVRDEIQITRRVHATVGVDVPAT